MQTFQFFEATHNSDTTEGRGHTVVIGRFKHHTDAAKAAKGQDVMGNDGDVRTASITIFESFEEYSAEVNAVLRQSALAKLSVAERNALGL